MAWLRSVGHDFSAVAFIAEAHIRRIILDDTGISPLLPIHSSVNALGIENCPFISEMNFLIDRRVPFYYARHLIKD